MAKTDIGIDLGSSNIVVYMRNKGVVISEPSMVAYDKDSDKILAFGEEAARLVERASGNIVGIRPLKNGVISDYSVTEKLLRHFLIQVIGRRAFLKPRLALSLPGGVTPVEKRACEEAAYQAGARDVTVVEESVAAAIGSGIDITKPVGNMVVDIGGATTKAAVISLGAPVIHSFLRLGSDNISTAITRYIRRTHGVFIGEGTAEKIKIEIGTVFKRTGIRTMQVTGRDVKAGVPKTFRITSDEIRMASGEVATEIVDSVYTLLEKTPPELAADIVERGIVLSGGGASIDGIEELIEERTGISAMTADNPMDCVAIGTGLYNEKMELLRMS
ncbi:MAG: rod shape-determining protein [Lachnospiraceae bacterium]|nr:rod shape-determining protein [Lachnospiraceae bacterium]